MNDLSCARLHCRSLPCGEVLSVGQVDLLTLIICGASMPPFAVVILHLYPACSPAGVQVSRDFVHVTGRCPRGRKHHTAMQYCSR